MVIQRLFRTVLVATIDRYFVAASDLLIYLPSHDEFACAA